MPTKQTPAKGQDSDIADITAGTNRDVTQSEDARRAEGTDASAKSSEHDPSPAANRGRIESHVLGTYDGSGSEHGNIAGGQPQPLIVGQAPDAPNTPQLGSENYGHKFHPEIPNPKNQSPMVRGGQGDPNVTSYAKLAREAREDDEDDEDAQRAPVQEVQPVE